MDTKQFMGEYLNAETSQEGDIVEILDEGKASKIGDKEVLNLGVIANSRALTYTPGKKAMKILITAWGSETKNWINKKFQVKHILTEINGKEALQLRPVPIS